MKLFPATEAKNLNNVLSKGEDPQESLFLEELHGFLFGLAITPEVIMPSEWYPMVFGEKGPKFEDEQDAQRCMGHLMVAYNRMIGEANAGSLRFPFDYQTMKDQEYELVEEWAYGLFLALSMRPDIWGMSEEYEDKPDEEIPEDILDVINSSSVITALALPDEREQIFEPMPGKQTNPDEELEDMLYGMLPLCVETLMHHGTTLQKKRLDGKRVPEKSIIKKADKVGRNELCPCGSGRKYKKCCGAN